MRIRRQPDHPILPRLDRVDYSVHYSHRFERRRHKAEECGLREIDPVEQRGLYMAGEDERGADVGGFVAVGELEAEGIVHGDEGGFGGAVVG